LTGRRRQDRAGEQDRAGHDCAGYQDGRVDERHRAASQLALCRQHIGKGGPTRLQNGGAVNGTPRLARAMVAQSRDGDSQRHYGRGERDNGAVGPPDDDIQGAAHLDAAIPRGRFRDERNENRESDKSGCDREYPPIAGQRERMPPRRVSRRQHHELQQRQREYRPQVRVTRKAADCSAWLYEEAADRREPALTVALYQGITDETASTRALTAIIKS